MTNGEFSTTVRHADYPSNTATGRIDAQIEYQFRPSDIVAVWRFKPTVDVLVSNLFTFIWTAYAPYTSQISSACLSVAPGLARKPSSYFTTDWWVGAPIPLVPNFPNSPYQAFATIPPPTSVKMALATPCGGINHDANTYGYSNFDDSIINNGTWIRSGDTSNLPSLAGRVLTMVNLEHSPSGAGTYQSPINIKYHRGIGWNESKDGTLGMGFARGPYTNSANFLRLLAGKWYYSSFALSSTY
jgi:hypothetical protein